MNKSSQKSSVGNSLPCLLFRPLAQKDCKAGNKARGSGPLPPLREQVDDKHESAVQTFTQSRLMGGCEFVDLSSTRSNESTDGRARLDVDLGLIGLKPEQLWSRLFLIKPDLQLNINSAIAINPTLLPANAHQAHSAMKNHHQDRNNVLQGNDDFYHTQDHDLFVSVGALGNNVPPIANDISSCNGANLPADSCYSLQYINLDTFQAEIGLSRNKHQEQVRVDVNTSDLDVASIVQKVQHQTGTRKRKQNKAPVERNISCSQCPRKFRSAGHLKLHFNSAHPSDGAISKCHCDICGKGFCHGGALALHKRRHA